MSEPFPKTGPEASEKAGQVDKAPHEMVAGVEPSPFRWLWILFGVVIVMSGAFGGWWVISHGGWPGLSPVLPTCGNGVVDESAGEECDGSTTGCQPGLLCENCQCVPLPTCGNGVVDGDMDTEMPEQCDGDDSPCPPCTRCQNCYCAPFVPDTCGNDIAEECEQCDGADLGTCIGGLVCNDWCRCAHPLCGNGELDEGESCEESGAAALNDCPQGYVCNDCQCVMANVCGNDIVDSGEGCELTDLTRCLAEQVCYNCQCVTIRCGNGIIEEGEQCDGDLTPCLAGQHCHNCQCMTYCGDGYCSPDENTDLCPQDCHCHNDGVCGEGEGLNCPDCGEPRDACGISCATSDDCPSQLSCFNAVCWEACLCGGDCGGGGNEGGTRCENTCTTSGDCHCPRGTCVDGCCSCP
jgi:hypothetical protein